jgi:hypothetical protein
MAIHTCLVTNWCWFLFRPNSSYVRPKLKVIGQMSCQVKYLFAALLVHTSLMICALTYVPNPPCQLSLWEETGVPGENPRLSAERWLYSFTWGLGSTHIEKFSLRFEPATLEVKGKCANHIGPWNILQHQRAPWGKFSPGPNNYSVTLLPEFHQNMALNLTLIDVQKTPRCKRNSKAMWLKYNMVRCYDKDTYRCNYQH